MKKLIIGRQVTRAGVAVMFSAAALIGTVAVSSASAADGSVSAQKEASVQSPNGVVASSWVDVAAYYQYQDCVNAKAAFPSGYAYCHWVGGTAPWHLAVWIVR